MNTEHRSILVLTGEQSACFDYCHAYFKHQNVLYVSQVSDNSTPTISQNQVITQLGQENTIVVFDATQHFDANALGLISGTIIGGGILVLLLPSASFQYPSPLFLKRLLRILKQHYVPVYPVGSEVIPPSLNSRYISNKKPSVTHSEINLTADQQRAVDAVIKVVKGRRRRPFVLTADRGRGKTTALGGAINALLDLGLTRIVICSPARAMIQPLLQQVGTRTGVVFVAPDELDLQRPEADIVIIDEAGAIPVPLLTRLLRHYSRIVFSTTLQGYEGNGKGFAIRFQQHLDTTAPDWRSLQLQTPIRWGEQDPLESLINEALLLSAESITPKLSTQFHPGQLNYQRLDPEQLATDEGQLRQLFGLLVIAHYQTRPSDLLQLLDSPDISVHVLLHENNIIAAAIVSHEGGFDLALSQQIYEGKRRPKGNLVPQILTFQLGIPQAAVLKTDRIMRIAVHPDCQRLQFGSHLLSLIFQQSTSDYLSSSFGLSNDLLHFWESSAFSTVHLGLKREASSGYHSAVMLCPLTPKGAALQTEAQQIFKRHFFAQLADILKHYEPDIVIDLLTSKPSSTKVDLSDQEHREVARFANGYCGYDLAMSALLRWLPNALAENHSRINESDAALLVMRVLQHHDWPHCCKALGLKGMKQALTSMQQAVKKLLNPVSESNHP